MKTTSYEISRQLAEAGFEAETQFYWVKWLEGEPELVHESQQTPNLIESVPAWDLETILEALPVKIKDVFYLRFCHRSIWYEWEEDDNKDKGNGIYQHNIIDNESLADTAARLWLKLKEKNLI